MANNWQSYNLQDLFPTDVDNTVSDIETVIGDISSFYTAMKILITWGTTFLSTAQDPFSLLTQSIVNTIRGIIDDLKNVPLYTLATIDDLDDPQGYVGFETKILESFLDFADMQRPQYAPTAWIGGFVLAFGAPSYTEFSNIITSFSKLLNFKKGTMLENINMIDGDKTQIMSDLATSSLKQTVAVTNAAVLPRRGGFIRIEADSDGNLAEETTYNKIICIGGRYYLEGVTIGRNHKAFSQVTYIFDSNNIEPKTNLVSDITPNPVAATITVNSTSGFSDTGILSLGGERIQYTIDGPTSFTGIITESHLAGEPITFVGARAGRAEAPDWQKGQIIDTFDQLGICYGDVESIAQLFAPLDNAQQLAGELSTMLDEKIVELDAFVIELKNQLTYLQGILTGTGFYILTIAPDVATPGTGVYGFRNNFKLAANNPPWPAGYFVGGMVAVVGSNTLGGAGGINTYWDTLKAIFEP